MVFIPLSDDNSRRRTFPYVVYGLIAANIAVWFLQLNLGDAFTNAYATVPFEITTGVDLAQAIPINVHGNRIIIQHFPGPSPLFMTVFSAMFMHGSWLHIIGNMVYLGIFGDQIEDELGHGRFLVFYIFCGLLAAVAHIALDARSVIPCLGASGAIAGVLGGYLITHPRNMVTVLFFREIVALPAILVLGAWFLMQIAGQFGSVGGAGGVAYAAHLGGFVAGVVAILIFGKRAQRQWIE